MRCGVTADSPFPLAPVFNLPNSLHSAWLGQSGCFGRSIQGSVLRHLSLAIPVLISAFMVGCASPPTYKPLQSTTVPVLPTFIRSDDMASAELITSVTVGNSTEHHSIARGTGEIYVRGRLASSASYGEGEFKATRLGDVAKVGKSGSETIMIEKNGAKSAYRFNFSYWWCPAGQGFTRQSCHIVESFRGLSDYVKYRTFDDMRRAEQQVSIYYKTIGWTAVGDAVVHNIERQQRDAEEQARYRAESQAAKELQERREREARKQAVYEAEMKQARLRDEWRMEGIQKAPRGTQRSCSVYYQLNQDSIVKCGNDTLPIRLYLTNGWKVIQQQPGNNNQVLFLVEKK